MWVSRSSLRREARTSGMQEGQREEAGSMGAGTERRGEAESLEDAYRDPTASGETQALSSPSSSAAPLAPPIG